MYVRNYSINPTGCLSTTLLIICNFIKTFVEIKTKTKLRGFSQQANYTNRAPAACRGS
jgi:hypothetical protein